jgi:hypothetical protein
MILSDEKISHLSHLILREIQEGGIVTTGEETQVLREIKRIIVSDLRLEDEADAQARKRLESYSRRVPEGSPEWNVLYMKFYDEEIKKRRRP